MLTKRPTTINEYIQAAHPEAQPHLRQLHAILQSVAPNAEETIKWGSPFFVEPRFVFAFSAHKAHLSFAPTPPALATFRDELAAFDTTKNYLKLPYAKPLPEALIRKIAEHQVQAVAAREGDSFW